MFACLVVGAERALTSLTGAANLTSRSPSEQADFRGIFRSQVLSHLMQGGSRSDVHSHYALGRCERSSLTKFHFLLQAGFAQSIWMAGC